MHASAPVDGVLNDTALTAVWSRFNRISMHGVQSANRCEIQKQKWLQHVYNAITRLDFELTYEYVEAGRFDCLGCGPATKELLLSALKR